MGIACNFGASCRGATQGAQWFRDFLRYLVIARDFERGPI